jgi:hypothetical protein
LVPEDPVPFVPMLPVDGLLVLPVPARPVLRVGGLFDFGVDGEGLTTACSESASAANAAEDGAAIVRTKSAAPATSHSFGAWFLVRRVLDIIGVAIPSVRRA